MLAVVGSSSLTMKAPTKKDSKDNDKTVSSSALTATAVGSALKSNATRNIQKDLENGNQESLPFHIVFSTDCSGYQHWQGILLYYSARRIRQPGVITRIASGCTPEQQLSIAIELRTIDPTETKFLVHFAPATALHRNNNEGGTHDKGQNNYKYSNKPGGILHWLQHRQPPLDDRTVVCLLDPDMILLKPITADLITIPNHDAGVQIRPHGKDQVEYSAEKKGSIAQLLRVKSILGDEINPIVAPSSSARITKVSVTTGNPAGQHFGIGGAWVQGMAPRAKPAWRNFSKAFVCGDEDAPCTTTSAADASHNYAVGPVTLATVADWRRMATTWWEFCPRVHQQYPFLLAEMYSLTMAMANLELPVRLVSSYMVTGADVSSPTEAWSWIDDLIAPMLQKPSHTSTSNMSVAHQICSGVDTYTTPDWTQDPGSLALPNTLHYCQRYKLDLGNSNGNDNDDSTFLFAKRKIPHDVFSCANNQQQQEGTALRPIPFDIQDLIVQASKRQASSWSATDSRSLFALCHAVPILNWARKIYQKEVCR